MKRELFTILCILFFSAMSLMAQEQAEPEVSPQEEKIEEVIEKVPEGGWKSKWNDPRMRQLEEIADQLEALMNKHVKISSAAVYEVRFSPQIGQNFRQAALSKMYQVFSRVPDFYAARCDECFQIRTKVSGNTLRVSRGIADPEYRRKIAMRMNTEGFMKIIISQVDQQISVAIEIYGAKNGQLLFSEVVAGTPPIPEPNAFDLYVGQMKFDVKFESKTLNYSHTQPYQLPTIAFGKSYQILEHWYFSGDITILADVGQKDDKIPKVTGGFTSLAFYGKSIYDFINIGVNDNVSFGLITGIGQWLSPQLKFPVLYSVGLRMMMGRAFLFNFEYLSTEIKEVKSTYTQPDTEEEIKDVKASISSATSISLGIRF